MWGHDFRPDYLGIAEAWRSLGSPPLLAMTATAPPHVHADIERRLFATSRRLRIIAGDTYRPNLRLQAIAARNEQDKEKRLVNLCRRLQGSGIIYARSRRRCEELADLLRRQGLDAAHYHAGIADRSVLQDRFMRGEVRVIVATVAFGMGVDKADIRFIIHYGLPDSLEAYYQEAGRAGRDGQPADCILLHSASDHTRLSRWAGRKLIDRARLRALYKVMQDKSVQGNPFVASWRELAAGNDDQTGARVALSVLEQAGLVQRGPDIPRWLNLWLRRQGGNPELDALVRAISLPLRQGTSYDFVELAAVAGVVLADLEPQLLAWQTGGDLRLYVTGRQLLLTLLPAPVDAAQRVDALLERYAAIQRRRCDRGDRICNHASMPPRPSGELPGRKFSPAL